MAITVQTLVWQALKARVATLPVGYAVSYPMEPFDPPVSANGKPLPYVECRHLPNDNTRLFIKGSDPHERMGILQLSLLWPVSDVGTGKTHPDVLTQKAGEIAAHFPADLALDFQGARVRVERAPDVAQPLRDEAVWRVPVSVRYRGYI